MKHQIKEITTDFGRYGCRAFSLSHVTKGISFIINDEGMPGYIVDRVTGIEPITRKTRLFIPAENVTHGGYSDGTQTISKAGREFEAKRKNL